jgi:DNA-binding MarR family transcriptional regulator
VPLDRDPIDEARDHWRARWGDEPARPMAAVTAVMRAQQRLLAALNAELKPFGLTFARYEALMLLSFTRTGALPIGKMGDRLQVHRTSVTSILDRLEADGLVVREPSERDRRATLARITDEGRRVAERATLVLNAGEFGLSSVAPLDQEALARLSSAVQPDMRTST